MSALEELVEELAAVFGPPLHNGASPQERATARTLLEAFPTAETPPATRTAWWRVVQALTADTLVTPPGCGNGHHVSELAWRSDTRLTNGGYYYCRACRREERRERGWS
jgi:hypothetical protein